MGRRERGVCVAGSGLWRGGASEAFRRGSLAAPSRVGGFNSF